MSEKKKNELRNIPAINLYPIKKCDILPFACLKSFWSLNQISIRALLGRLFLVLGSSSSSPQIHLVTAFWLVEFLLKSQLLSLCGVPLYVICCLPLWLLKLFNFYLIFVSFIYMCLTVFLPEFILYGILCASSTWETISFPILEKFLGIISSNIFSGPFFYLLLLEPLWCKCWYV